MEATRHVQARVPESVYVTLKMMAAKRTTTIQGLLEQIIQAALSTNEGRAMAEAAGADSPQAKVDLFFREAPLPLRTGVLSIVEGWAEIFEGKTDKKKR